MSWLEIRPTNPVRLQKNPSKTVTLADKLVSHFFCFCVTINKSCDLFGGNKAPTLQSWYIGTYKSESWKYYPNDSPCLVFVSLPAPLTTLSVPPASRLWPCCPLVEQDSVAFVSCWSCLLSRVEDVHSQLAPRCRASAELWV